MKKHVVIIGAGIGGLATANMLAKAGYRVSVYEKNAEPGGRAGTLSIDGFTFDTGPSWYLMPDVFKHYFSLFDKRVDELLQLTKLDPAYKVFFENNTPLTVTGDIEKDAQTFESIESGAGEKLRDYVRRGDEIYKLSLDHFLYTNFSSIGDFLKVKIVGRSLQLLRLAFTPIDSYVQRYVRDYRLKQILEYPMVFLGSSPFSAPAIYSLMSALDFKEGVFYPQGGIYSIIKKLVAIGEDLGVNYHYGTPVERILTKNGDVSGVLLKDHVIVDGDIVISNADLHFTETKLLEEKDRSYPEMYWKKREAGPSAMLMYLGVEGSIDTLEHHNLYFVKDWRKNFDNIFEDKVISESASLYVCKPSATDETVAPSGTENVFVLVPLPAGVSMDREIMDQMADRYLEIMETQMDIPDLRGRLKVKRLFGPNDFSDQYNAWLGSALGPSHVLRQSALFRTSNKSKKVNNLYYVGGFTTPGIGLPMCLISAELVYKRLAGLKKGGPIDMIHQIEDVR